MYLDNNFSKNENRGGVITREAHTLKLAASERERGGE